VISYITFEPWPPKAQWPWQGFAQTISGAARRVGIVLHVKIRAQNIPEVERYESRHDPWRALVRRLFRAGDDILVFDRLDPESRREVSQVGNDVTRGAG